MENKENNQLKKSSLILMTIAGISLFMMLAFFSYSMFGGGKGTYSNTVDEEKHRCYDLDHGSSYCDEWRNKNYTCVLDHTSGEYTYYDCTCSGIVDNDGICTPLASYTLTLDSNGGKFVGNTASSILNNIINNSNKTELTLTSDNNLIECDSESCSFSLISALSATRDGYQFNGWGTSSSCTSVTTNTITYTSDVTYYACWLKVATEDACYACGGSQGAVLVWKHAGETTTGCSIQENIPHSQCPPGNEEGCYVVNHNSNTYKHWASTKSDAISHFNGICGTCGSSAVLDSNLNQTQCQSVSDTSTSCQLTIDPNTSSGGSLKSGFTNPFKYSTCAATKSELDANVTNSNSSCTIDKWIVTDDGNREIYNRIDEEENGKTLQAHWNCNSGGSGGGNGGGSSSSSSSSSSKPSTAPSSSDAEYEELKPAYDRCYNNKWVRVESCQPDGTGAKCKLSTGETVDKATIKKAKTTGCDVPGDAFDASITEGDRCNMATGKLVYIVSCQPFDDVIGAHCKDNKGNYVFMGNLADKENSACKNDKPSTEGSSDDPANQDVDKSVQTGTTAFVLSWIAGIIALVISFYYFRKNYFVKQ